MKKQIRILLPLLTLLLLTSMPVYAAGKAETNKKAMALYEARAKKLHRQYDGEAWYADLTGDGIKEAVYNYHSNKHGSSRSFEIYSYKNGKMIRILNELYYGLTRFTYYTKSKSFVIYGMGHGNEWYVFYKLSGGKYKQVAQKGRHFGGYDRNPKWYLTQRSGNSFRELDISEYNSIVKSVKKGKGKILFKQTYA